MNLALSLSIAALLLSAVSLIIGCVALAIIVGLKNSTHQIQYINPFSDDEIKDTEKALEEEFNNIDGELQ